MSMSPYLVSMRDRIGHDLLLLPSVNIMIFDDQDRVCMVRNLQTGRWTTVGGAIEPDEEPADAARREAFEETGLEVEIERIVGVYGGHEFRLLYPNGDLCSYVSICFAGRVVGGEARPDGVETMAVGWFSHAETRDFQMPARVHRVIADAFAKRPLPRF